ncbi:hypothetical protein [Carboxylicivirga sp. N1Y90]
MTKRFKDFLEKYGIKVLERPLRGVNLKDIEKVHVQLSRHRVFLN